MATRIDSIQRSQKHGGDARIYYPVVIIGAGVAGIAMACRLKQKLGFDQLRIFESSAGIGGTWWSQRYPGVASDVPALFYSFSFAPNPNWSTIRPSGPEFLSYLHRVCEEYQIIDKFQLTSEIVEIRWVQEDLEWELLVGNLTPGSEMLTKKQKQEKAKSQGMQAIYSKTEVVRAKVVVSAVGLLVEPASLSEDVPGIENFQGDILHSARWDTGVDLNGKDIVVVGTGSSAAQIVPELVETHPEIKSLTQLMRTPPWVSPYLARPVVSFYESYGPWLMRNIPGLARLTRAAIFWRLEYDYLRIMSDGWYARWKRPQVEEQLLRYMESTAPKEYHSILRPDYGVGCKRRVFDMNWLPVLNHPSVKLLRRPLRSIQSSSVTLGPEDRTLPATAGPEMQSQAAEINIPADVLVLATGYQASTWAHLPPIRGRDGKSLRCLWRERGGPQAYLGTAIDGFPNFFMLFGPNTAVGHSSAILAIENGVHYALHFIPRILNGEVSTYEVKESASRAWVAKVQNALKGTVLATGGCSSWYMTENGWNPTVYPFSQIDATWRSMFPVWSDWDTRLTLKGRRELRVRRMSLASLCCLACILTASAFLGLSPFQWVKQAFRAWFPGQVRWLNALSARIMHH